MFSARDSQGKVLVSGRLPTNPRSIDYFCKVCDSPVSYVAPTQRRIRLAARTVPISEHFRHPQGANIHPLPEYSWQANVVMNQLLENFRDAPWIEVDTDRVFQTNTGLEYAVNMLVTEHRIKIDKRDYTEQGDDSKLSAIIIASGQFNGADLGTQIHDLSQRGIHALIILSAQGEVNSAGKYYRNADRENAPATTKLIKGNEKDLLAMFGALVYYDHDTQMFVVSKFRNYCEPLGPDPSSDCRYCMEKPEYPSRSPSYCRPHWFAWGELRSRGETHRELETIKLPEEIFRGNKFALTYDSTRDGRIRIARPAEIPDYYGVAKKELMSLEKAIAQRDLGAIEDLTTDRIPIMLEGNNVPLGLGPDAYFRQLITKVENR